MCPCVSFIADLRLFFTFRPKKNCKFLESLKRNKTCVPNLKCVIFPSCLLSSPRSETKEVSYQNDLSKFFKAIVHLSSRSFVIIIIK